MAESASGQDEANPAFWLATRAEKMGPARLSRLGFFALVPKEKVIFLAIQLSKCQNGWMLASFFFVFLLISTTRVPNRFLGIRDYKARSGLKVCPWGGIPKITAGITGLREMLGRDYGIEELYWGPSTTSLSIKACRRPRPISSHLDLTLGQ